MTVASKWFDLVVGIDLHFEIVPASPAPIPFPHPFVGVVFDPVGLIMDEVIGAAMELMGAPPPPGPVLVGGVPATATGDDASMPTGHILLPPGISWAPIPKVPIPGGSGKPSAPDLPAPPAGDAMLFFGSATVEWRGGRAVRMGDMALSCSDPVRLPTSFVISTAPTGVMVGGPPAPDWAAIAAAVAFGALRTKFASNLIHAAVEKFTPKRLNRARDFLHDAACFVTGHPVNVVNGSMFTTWSDLELPGPIPLELSRRYRSSFCDRDIGLGFGWTHSLDQRVWLEEGRVVVLTEDGRELEFDTWDFPDKAMRKGDEIFDPVSRFTLRSLGQFCWTLTGPDGLVRDFGPIKGESTANKDRGLVRLRHIRNLAGDTIEFQYDEAARLGAVIDSGGRTIRLEYARDGRLSRLWVPTASGDGLRQHAQYTYSDAGDLVEVHDAAGKSVRLVYDRHNLVKETDRNGVSFFFEYEGWGPFARCTRTWGDGRIYDHVITYDVRGRKTIVEDSFGNPKVYEYGPRGVVTKIIDARGGVTEYEYDELLRRTVEIDPLGHKTRTTYDERSRPIMVVEPDGATTKFTYDAQDRLLTARTPTGGQWRWTYDRAGRPVTKTDPLGASARYHYQERRLVAVDSPASTRTMLSHDSAGNLAAVTHPDGTTEKWQHDALGNVVASVDAKGTKRRFTHDAFNRVVRIAEPDGNVRQLQYDGEGNLVRAVDKLRSVEFTYQGLGKVTSRTIAGQTVRYEYDTEERLTAFINEKGLAYRFERDPLGDVLAEMSFDEAKRIYERDACGRVAKLFRPGVGQSTTYERDPAGRVLKTIHSDGVQEEFVYDEAGAIVEARNGDSALRFERDALGRVVKEHQGDAWVASQFDHRGLRIGVESSMGARQTIERNPMGDVVGLMAQHGEQKWQAAITRDALGQEVDRQLPGQVRSYWWRDDMGRPTQHWVGREKQLTRGRKYGWGVDDRLERIVEEGQGETRFEHDRRGTLVGVTYPNGAVTTRAADPVGNLFRDAQMQSREYGPVGELKKETTAEGVRVYRYDPEGQLVAREDPNGDAWVYEWDGAGRLRKVVLPDEREVEFAYDPLGRRVSKTIDGKTTAWVWDGDVVLHEVVGDADTSDDAGDVTTWVFDPETFAPAARLHAGDGVHSVVTDHLGAPLCVIDGDGATKWQGSIDAWGRMSVAGEAKLCPWRFPGQYEDAETGLYYNRFRYFDPSQGGYVSRDPIGLRGGEGLYGYVDDPLVAVDPLGLARKDYRAPDPGLDDFIKDLEARGIPVRNKNIEIMGPDGNPLGEVDVVTDAAVIQFKAGVSSARDIVKQVQEKTEPYVTRPVIGFIGNTGKAGNRTVRGAGDKILVTNDIDLLADVLR